MPIRVRCPSCDTRLSAADTAIGKTINCPECRTPVMVQGPATPADEPGESGGEIDERPRRKRPSGDGEHLGGDNGLSRRSKSKGKKANSPIGGLIAVVCILSIGSAGFAIYWFVVREKDKVALGVQPDLTQRVKPAASRPAQPPPPPTGPPTEFGKLNTLTGMAFSQDSRQLAGVWSGTTPRGAALHSLQLWNLSTGKEAARLYEGNDEPGAPVFSPDGKRVATTVNSNKGYLQAMVWGVNGGNQPITVPLPTPGPKDRVMTYIIGFLPDGGSLLATSGSTISRVSLPAGTATPVEGLAFDENTTLTCSPTAPVVVALPIGRSVLIVLDVNSGHTHDYPLPPGEKATEVVFSGDGRTLGVSRLDSIELWDTKTWKPRATLKRPPGGDPEHLSALSLSHDAMVVVASSSAPFIADRSKRASRTSGVHIWTGLGASYRALEHRNLIRPRVSPDGTMIAATQPDLQFVLLDAATGEAKSFGP